MRHLSFLLSFILFSLVAFIHSILIFCPFVLLSSSPFVHTSFCHFVYLTFLSFRAFIFLTLLSLSESLVLSSFCPVSSSPLVFLSLYPSVLSSYVFASLGMHDFVLLFILPLVLPPYCPYVVRSPYLVVHSYTFFSKNSFPSFIVLCLVFLTL